MSKETKEHKQSTISLLQSISASAVPYAGAAGSIISMIGGTDKVSTSVTLLLPDSVRRLMDSGAIPESSPINTKELMLVLEQMAEALEKSNPSYETLDDQQLEDKILYLRDKYRTYSSADLQMESRYAHKEVEPLTRRAKLFVLSDLMNDKGLPVPTFWTNYLV